MANKSYALYGYSKIPTSLLSFKVSSHPNNNKRVTMTASFWVAQATIASSCQTSSGKAADQCLLVKVLPIKTIGSRNMLLFSQLQTWIT